LVSAVEFDGQVVGTLNATRFPAERSVMPSRTTDLTTADRSESACNGGHTLNNLW